MLCVRGARSGGYPRTDKLLRTRHMREPADHPSWATRTCVVVEGEDRVQVEGGKGLRLLFRLFQSEGFQHIDIIA
jgi:hypothetical protein